MTYLEGLEAREQWAIRAVAELRGYVDAAFMTIPQGKYEDPEQQRRYEQGLADGVAIRQQSEVKA